MKKRRTSAFADCFHCISHVLFLVKQGGSHLSVYCYTHLELHFALDDSPTKFGFLACGVYLVPLLMFPLRLRHCDTLRESAIDNVLRLFLRRHQSVPGLIDWTSTNTTTISDRASMDFPLENTSGCLTYVIAC